jgi:DTW domain-containing protein YfiP
MHVRESYKTTNTGRLAHKSLNQSRVLLRGDKTTPLNSLEHFPEGPTYLCLCLTEDAVELSPELLSQLGSHLHLVVPDGNWRQANKMPKREPALKNMLKVKLPAAAPSSYRLRREHHIEGLATIEAIARAYGILESAEVQAKLENIFLTMVERTLQTRAPNTI